MPHPDFTDRAAKVINQATKYCTDHRHEFVTPEHLLYFLTQEESFNELLYPLADDIGDALLPFLQEMESVPAELDYVPDLSEQMKELMPEAISQVQHSSAKALDIVHLTSALMNLKESQASYLLNKAVDEISTPEDFLGDLISWYENTDDESMPDDDDDFLS